MTISELPRLGRLALSAALLLSGAAIPAAAAGATETANGVPAATAECEPVIERATRVADLVRRVGKNARVISRLERAAQARSGRSIDLVELADDPTVWVGQCGEVHYVEPISAFGPAPAPQQIEPLDQTFELESRPGVGRVVYLDFNGQTVSGSYWNKQYGDPIVAAPFSLDTDVSTNFSDVELRHIQNVWAAVAEDFAPFNVNVTTKDPGTAGIRRSTSSDTQYGSRVLLTQGGPIADECGCAGVALLGTFGRVEDSEYTQPAWVFGSGSDVYDALTASHEVGHNFALRHHGTSTSPYYAGSGPWIPLMGGGAARRVSQWSDGSYLDANNTGQDDLALIAAKAPFTPDDHVASGAGVPTQLIAGQSVRGDITTRTDRDSFSFTAGGDTTISVTHQSWLPNLDVGLTIRDALGNHVAYVDPLVSSDGRSGLAASWSGTLPSGGYVATVDGVGSGDPAIAGRYSDYASLGRYAIIMTTTTITTTSDPTTEPEPTTVPEPTTTTPTATTTTVPFADVAPRDAAPSRMKRPKALVRRGRLIVKWAAAETNGSVVKGYKIDFRRGRDRVVGDVRRTVFRGLEPGRHKVRIAARSSAGRSAYSKWVTVRLR